MCILTVHMRRQCITVRTLVSVIKTTVTPVTGSKLTDMTLLREQWNILSMWSQGINLVQKTTQPITLEPWILVSVSSNKSVKLSESFHVNSIVRCTSVNDLTPSYISDMFQEKTVNYNLRRTKLITQPKFLSQTHGYHSLRQEGTRLWDTLPNICKVAKVERHSSEWLWNM